MTRLNSTIAALFSCFLATYTAVVGAEERPPEDDSMEQYLYHPKHRQTHFDTDVEPLHKSSLQGFNCMDQDKDGYLTKQEIERRNDCVKNAEDRGLDLSIRTSVIIDRLDADRDLKVSKREFNIWNEMQRQKTLTQPGGRP